MVWMRQALILIQCINRVCSGMGKGMITFKKGYFIGLFSSMNTSDDYIQIIVDTLTGKRLTFVVKLSAKVEKLREKIEEKEGIPFDVQRLTYAGQRIEDWNSLSDYNIKGHIHKLILDERPWHADVSSYVFILSPYSKAFS